MSAIVLRGDAAHLPLPDGSVDLIVTSPPYFGQRDYRDGGESMPGQIGAEETPREYIAALLDCTREWVRVLKPEGSLFVNLGDKYNSNGGAQGQGTGGQMADRALVEARRRNVGAKAMREDGGLRRNGDWGYPNKSLMGLPWRYAIGCIDDLGLILRAEIVWAKPNGLPESVTDRVRRSHEQVFHFVKQPRYYSAVDEVREAHQPQSIARTKRNRFAPDLSQPAWGSPNTLDPADGCNPLGKLPGSVWSIPSQPLTVPAHVGVDHFAAFPMELPRRIILGWSPPGICTACGQGRRPVVEGGRKGDGSKPHKAAVRVSSFDWAAWKEGEPHRITGYACACPDATAPVRPGVVLDPFGGTGTTALVASVHGRTGISVDRSADYCRLARWRVSDPGERARAMQVPKPPAVPQGQGSLFGEEVIA